MIPQVIAAKGPGCVFDDVPLLRCAGCVALMKLLHQGPEEAIEQTWNSDIPDTLTSVEEAWRLKASGSTAAATSGCGSGFGVPAFICNLTTLLQQVGILLALSSCRAPGIEFANYGYR